MLLGPVPARATPLIFKITLRHLVLDIDLGIMLFVWPAGLAIVFAYLPKTNVNKYIRRLQQEHIIKNGIATKNNNCWGASSSNRRR